MRKWKSMGSALLLPVYLLFMSQAARLTLWLINFTNYAWLGFLLFGVMLIGLGYVFISTFINAINLWYMRKYLKENKVTKLPWYYYWGLNKEEVAIKVHDQQQLLKSEGMTLLPESKAEDISYAIRTWRTKIK